MMLMMMMNDIVFYRQRESGDSPYAVKLSVEELECFYKQIATLPSRISEQSIVAVRFSYFVCLNKRKINSYEIL